MHAWRVVRHGRPSEALRLERVPEPTPGPGQARVRVRASVCNFNEVDGCYGRYRTIDPTLPYTLGMECAGVVDAAGAGAERWLGRRFAARPHEPDAFLDRGGLTRDGFGRGREHRLRGIHDRDPMPEPGERDRLVAGAAR